MAAVPDPVAPAESDPAAPCPNCGAAPAGGTFCPTCGQRNDRLRVTARALWGDLAEGVFKVDRKVPSTARSLFIPGQLTIDHLQGRRARHLRPLSLFLFLAGLHYLAWSSTRRPEEGFRFQSGLFQAQFDLGPGDGGARASQADAGAPGAADGGAGEGWLRARVSQGLAAHPERPAAALDALQSPKGQLALVLAYTLGVMAAARRRRFYLSEHLTFVLHLQAFGGLAGAAALVLGVPGGAAGMLSLVYDAVAFHRVYRFGLWGTLWRFWVVLLVATLVLSLILGATVVAYLLW